MDKKKSYDSTFCGSLPLHLINQVQPYGILLVVSKNDLNIIQVSENIESVTGLSAASLISAPLSKYILPEQIATLKETFITDIIAKVPMRITLNGDRASCNFLAITHAKDNYFILELEPVQEQNEGKGFIDVYQEVKYTMANINIANTTSDICYTALQELKKISGFDRLMIYEFDEDWNGTVIAELMEEGLEPYLGLRFPASDIPKQARDLYFKNPYRLIPTRDYTPAKIYPVINSVSKSFIDLSNCNLRSVPAVHLEYLKNMNVMASMSTAIIKEDKLWGLISCHHRTPKYLSYEKCSQFELLAGVISSRLSSIENKEERLANTALQQVQAQLIKQVYAESSLSAGLKNFDTTILDLLKSEGAAIAYGRKIETVGKTPGISEIKDLIFWLQSHSYDKAFTETNIASVFEDAEQYAHIASGMIVLPIHVEKGEFVIGFRPEVIEQVNWGGNPNEAIRFEEDNIKYHPRNSFKLWQQIVKGTSLPWKKEEVAIAESFRNFIIEFTLKKLYAGA